LTEVKHLQIASLTWHKEETMLEQQNPGAQPVMRRLERLCDASAAIGALVLVAVAGMTSVSVIGRAFFSHPILGDVELVQLGAAVVVASFLPYTQFRRANIVVDFFTASASASAQRRMDAFGVLLYTLVLALVTWRVAAGGVSIYTAQERSMLMDLPLWIPYLLMLPGLSLCVLIGAVQSLDLLRSPAGAIQ
jgi:TRAP-type C4-dicarboxylate transport system permease small subunit